MCFLVLVHTCKWIPFRPLLRLTFSSRFNQWSGINSLAYFLPITFERNIHLDSQLALIISGVLGVQYFLVSWLPYFFIEKAGRRMVMMLSAAGCSFCMVMITVMLEVNTLAVGLPNEFHVGL